MSDLKYKYILPIKQGSGENSHLDYSKIAEGNLDDKHEFFRNLSKLQNSPKHLHVRLNEMYTYFGRHDSVGITRDYFDKFLSSLRYFYNIAQNSNLSMIRSADDVDNRFIIEVFDHGFFNISENRMDETHILMNRLVEKDSIDFVSKFNFPIVFNSIMWWNSGNELTHGFDISELDKFKGFIENKFNKEIMLEDKNRHPHVKFPNLIINEELKGHIWKIVEKKYHTKKIF
jgi:hypothetical protein